MQRGKTDCNLMKIPLLFYRQKEAMKFVMKKERREKFFSTSYAVPLISLNSKINLFF